MLVLLVAYRQVMPKRVFSTVNPLDVRVPV